MPAPVDGRDGLPAPPAPTVSSTAAPGAITGAQRAAKGANSGPAMITVGMAISRPRASVMPRSAFRTPIAASGPGCGGTNPCSTESPASVGIAIFISGCPDRWATSRMIGTSSTRPISKNIGSPIRAPTSAIAHGRVRALERSTMVSTISDAPPESASSLPNIAPSAMSTPTEATVAPTPVEKLSTALDSSAPATAPVMIEPIVSARNGCTLSQVISTTMTAMPISAAAISWPPLASLIGSTVRNAVITGCLRWVRGSTGSGR